jgi:hypothetical protein
MVYNPIKILLALHFVTSVLLEFPADQLHRLIGQDGDEEVAIATLFKVIIDRAHAELGFQTPKYRFQIG